MATVRFGIERCIEERPACLESAAIGVLSNHASVTRELHFSVDVLAQAYPDQIKVLFSPQHGFWAEQQANMIESPHSRHEKLGVPLFSLYSETRRPEGEMLEGLDVLIIDLQDVGTRVYTYAWTMLACLEACADAGISILILDRPNPLGCRQEGPRLHEDFRSFVGGACIPMRHGLTLGQLAVELKSQRSIAVELHVLEVTGSSPDSTFDQLDRRWLPPSPNLPRFESALVYPGQVLLEGTNLSEGRGTTWPFETCGAPFIDGEQLAEDLAEYGLAGIQFLPTRFTPWFDKWTGESCGGVTMHVTDIDAFRPYAATLALLSCVFSRYSADAEWLPPPYEYETRKMPIDILSGSSILRQRMDVGRRLTPEEIDELSRVE